VSIYGVFLLLILISFALVSEGRGTLWIGGRAIHKCVTAREQDWSGETRERVTATDWSTERVSGKMNIPIAI
jgi:hypothetical protein